MFFILHPVLIQGLKSFCGWCWSNLFLVGHNPILARQISHLNKPPPPPPSRKQVYLLCFYCNAAFNSIKVYIKPELSVKFFFTFINNKTKCLAIQTIHWLNDCCDSHLSRWLIRMILSYMLQTGTRLGKCLLAIVTLVWSTPSVSAHMTH